MDFATLVRLNQEYTTEELRERESDIVWQIRWKNQPLYILLLLEFQSSIEHFMAVRVLSYLCLLYLDIIKSDKNVQKTGILPPVLPFVLYSGKRPWNAPVTIDALMAQHMPEKLQRLQPTFRYLLLDEGRYQLDPHELESSDNLVLPLIALEQSSEPEQALAAVTKLVNLLKKSGFDTIKRAYTVYLNRVLKIKEVLPNTQLNELYEVQQMLAERVNVWIQRGVEQGREQGREEGREQGREQGMEQGVEKREYEALKYLIEKKFGPLTAEHQAYLGRVVGKDNFLELMDQLLDVNVAEDIFSNKETVL